MNVLVTGGSGFIGSNFIKYLLTTPEAKEFCGDRINVVNLDALTYAGKGKNLEYIGLSCDSRYKFIQGDICNKGLVNKTLSTVQPDLIVNFAAESHVDRSIQDTEPFRRTNFEGAGVLLDAAITHGQIKFIQISTDEVYGSLNLDSPSSKEIDPKHPRSAYSATKSAAEDLAIAAFETHDLPLIITRSSNNYGEFQFPEKILPLFITNLIDKKKVPLMWSQENPGLNVRDWLYVLDNCRAIWYVSQKGKIGEVYNIPGNNERSNIDLTHSLLSAFGLGEEMIKRVPHRKGHDFRYSIDGSKLKKLGFKHTNEDWNSNLLSLVDWYKQNEKWWRSLKK
jgi:dTDP-glucose 4,6-dehydratase